MRRRAAIFSAGTLRPCWSHSSRATITRRRRKTKQELFLVSSYFVPGKQGVALLADVHQRGARVVVITNSLASTDAVMVHSKYQLYCKPLVEAGVELYEIKPTAGALHERRGGTFHGPGGSGSASFHAKTFSFDRRIGFIGSYNLDPALEQTEHGDGCSLQLSGAGEPSARNDRTRSGS